MTKPHITVSSDPRLHRQLYEEYFPPGDGNSQLRKAAYTDGLWLVARSDGAPVAWLGLEATDSVTVCLSGVGVTEAYRGQGLQRRLMRRAFKECRALGVKRVETFVEASNIPSLRNLVAVGFVPQSARSAKCRSTGCDLTFIDLELAL